VKKIDNIFSKLFGLLVLFLENDLSPQQRQIWFELSMNYQKNKTLSGLEIAEKIGASKISKGVYASIRVLESRNLIVIHQTHPRAFAIQANEKTLNDSFINRPVHTLWIVVMKWKKKSPIIENLPKIGNN